MRARKNHRDDIAPGTECSCLTKVFQCHELKWLLHQTWAQDRSKLIWALVVEDLSGINVKSYKKRGSLFDALKPSSAPQTLTCKPITWGSCSSAHFGSMSRGMGMKFCFSTNTLPPHPEAVTGIRGPHGSQQGLQSDARWCGKQKWIFKLRGRASNPWKPPQLH